MDVTKKKSEKFISHSEILMAAEAIDQTTLIESDNSQKDVNFPIGSASRL